MPKILVIDDDPLMVDWLVPALQSKGMEAEGYCDPFQGFERLKEGGFDLLVSDLYMNGLDGKTLTVQTKEFNSDIPVIIITAYPSTESIMDLSTTGISDYITKPFDIEKLFESINTAIQQKSS